MEKEKIYCGTGRQKFETMVEITINLTKIGQHKDQYFEHNGEKYIKLKVAKRKEPDKFGHTHYVEVDTYKRQEEKELPF